MDILNRAYEGVPAIDGGAVIKFVETHAMGAHGSKPFISISVFMPLLRSRLIRRIWKPITLFGISGRPIGRRILLSVGVLMRRWHRRSGNIRGSVISFLTSIRLRLTVRLRSISCRSGCPLKGIGIAAPDATALLTAGNNRNVRETGSSTTVTYPVAASTKGDLHHVVVKATGATAAVALPEIYAELQGAGVTISLSNLELARKTQAFAKLRAEYSGHTDDYIIDLLMDAITIPDQQLTQPILVGEAATVFGMSKRYASDSGNLTESVVNGATFVDLNIRCPRIGVGGVIMIVCEITPEQLFERQKDPYFHADGVEDFPQYLRDTLDPEKVVVVPNNFVDVDHDTPDATFGYAPLNHEWNYIAPRIGGKFYRPEVDAGFDEDRQRLWAVETQNRFCRRTFISARTCIPSRSWLRTRILSR